MPPSPSPDRRRYAPLTPSPLNPNTYLNATKPRQQQHHHHQQQPIARTKPPNTNLSRLPQQYAALVYASPTERLVRQKAAAAWRCETLRHYVLLKPQPGAEHPRQHHRLVDFAVTPPTPTDGSHNSSHHSRGHNHNSDSNNTNRNPPTTLERFPTPYHSRSPQPSHNPSPQHPRASAPHLWATPPTPPTPYTDTDTNTDINTNTNTYTYTNTNTDTDTDTFAGADTNTDDVAGDIGLGITRPGYRDIDDGAGSIPLTSPLLSPALLLLGEGSGFGSGSGSNGSGSANGSGSGSGGMVLPLHAGSGSGAVKQRAGRRRVGGGGGGGVGVRRVLVVVALFLGMGLIHGLVSAFGSGGGGRPPAPAER